MGFATTLRSTLRRPTLTRRSAIWIGSIAFVYVVGAVELLTADPAVALQNWYVLAIPMILAAVRYGRMGAAISSGASLGMLIAIFRAAGSSVEHLTDLVENLLTASTSPSEAQRLAVQLADLRASDPGTQFQRALIGMGLLIVMSFLLGNSVDMREAVVRTQDRVLRQLRRYFSPRLVEYLTASEDTVEGAPVITLRKEVTVLFSDLRDFTPLAEASEPEEVLDLLNQYLDAMTDEVFREGGTLDKYMGDGVMAFFGDPGVFPDHAERAFRAALRMQGRMAELHASWHARGWSTPGMGIGICTGHVTVGNIGSATRMEYTALGSTVNAAARLSSMAGPAEILTTRKTFSRVQQLVHGRPKGYTALKGFSQEVEVIEVTGTRAIAEESEELRSERRKDLITAVVDDDRYRAIVLTDPAAASVGPRLDPSELTLVRDVAFLCGYPLFGGVPAAEILALLDGSSVEVCAPGVVLGAEGTVSDRLCIVVEGDAVVTIGGGEGRERHIASLSGGDVFGEISLLGAIPKVATVRASTRCRFLAIPREDAQQLLEQAPVFRERLDRLARRRQRDRSAVA